MSALSLSTLVLLFATLASCANENWHSTDSLDPLGWMDKPCQPGYDSPCSDWGEEMCCFYQWSEDGESGRIDEYVC